MHGRNWLVRRAERRLAPDLGKLIHIASSSRIFWSWLLPCLIIGFVFGTIGQFVSPANSSDHTPDRFQNMPVYLVTCLLTGLVLWSLTFGMAFRKLLVFDGGMVASYAQERTTRIFRWSQVAPESIKVVTSHDGSSPAALLVAKEVTRLGVTGKYALVFRSEGPPDPHPAGGRVPDRRFWTFESNQDPAPLVRSIQDGMVAARIPGAEWIAPQSLPPAVVTSKTALD